MLTTRSQLYTTHKQVCKMQTLVYRCLLGYNDKSKPLFPVEKRTLLHDIDLARKQLTMVTTNLERLYNQLLKETENEF